MQPQNGGFFGLRLSQPNVPLQFATPNQLLYQNDLQTETWRDNQGNITMQVGLLDSSSSSYGITLNNGTMTVAAPEGTITIGTESNGAVGLESVDSNSDVLFKMNGATWYWYDVTNGKNVMQIGLLPDGTYGLAIAKPGYNVGDAIT